MGIGKMSNQYEVGYKKPPKHTRFGEPNGNKPGLSSEAAQALQEASNKVALFYKEAMDDLDRKVADARVADNPDKYAALSELRGDVLKLLKDVMDRAHGAPKASIDQTSSDGSMSPQNTSDAVLDALKRKHSGGEGG